MQYPFLEKKVDLGDCCISYFERDRPSNSTPILFIQGWGVLTEPYEDVLNLLGERYRVIVPILPGLGNSSAPKNMTEGRDYAEVFTRFAQALNLQKIHAIGHSLGGAIAVELAVLTPSLVRSLILCDSIGIPLGTVPEVLLKRAIEMPAQAGQMKLKPTIAVFQGLAYNSLFNPLSFIQSALLSVHQDLRPILPKIESPCLIMWGKNDMLTPISFAHEFARLIPKSRLEVVDEVYHEWLLFFPEKFAISAFNFLAEFE